MGTLTIYPPSSAGSNSYVMPSFVTLNFLLIVAFAIFFIPVKL
jgi:hypothetical protein